MKTKKIVVVAGDKSGDLYGGVLSKKIREKFKEVEIYSFGGEILAQNSYQIINLLSHSVSGIFEVMSSLSKLIKIYHEILKAIEIIKPDLIILIDFPDFNLKLAKKLNRKYPLFYYISPQVWAWREKRIDSIRKYVDKIIVIFKFEEELYKKENIDVLYFGHPLLDIIDKQKVEVKNIISFMPGSRKNEIKKHLPLMQKTKAILEKELKGYQFRIIKPPNLEKKLYEKFSLSMDVTEHSYQAIKESKFIIASSGTATIEITILEVPYLIIYKINFLSWQILKRIVNAKFIGMANILASEKIVEELLQKEARPEKIARLTLAYLKDEEKYLNLQKKLNKIKEKLLPYGASDKFATLIGEFLKLPLLT
ncbi:MAG: lipid-A-disaccharide synthase [Candidatus Omnitrophica bacterium]|jgi:lipid-A-disaccharide synthase|nr:lipid-A-disaccharide synthase [Candidatus Omnitrophota bacterium]